jgi:hypothetical protein
VQCHAAVVKRGTSAGGRGTSASTGCFVAIASGGPHGTTAQAASDDGTSGR